MPDTKAIAILKKVVKDPGTVFALSNVFAFSQGDSALAMFVVLIGFVICVAALLWDDIKVAIGDGASMQDIIAFGDKHIVGGQTPLRIVAVCTLVTGFLVIFNNLWLGIAGFAFAIGNWIAAELFDERSKDNKFPFEHPRNAIDAAFKFFSEEVWSEPTTKVLTACKALFHPAFWWGLGYIGIGIVAADEKALIGCLVVTLGSGYLIYNELQDMQAKQRGEHPKPFNRALPTWLIAIGTLINGAAGIVTGNVVGGLGNLSASYGEVLIALTQRNQFKDNMAAWEKSAG